MTIILPKMHRGVGMPQRPLLDLLENPQLPLLFGAQLDPLRLNRSCQSMEKRTL
jgi:hypothetical protein